MSRRGSVGWIREQVMESVPHLSDVNIVEIGFSFQVFIKLKWYAWLTFGYLHLVSKRRVDEVVTREKPIQTVFSVRFWK